MIRKFFETRRARKAELAEQEERNAAAFERGRELASQSIEEIDRVLANLVSPWAENLLEIFTVRVATEVIFGDDPPADARAELSHFYSITDEQFAVVREDVRSHLTGPIEVAESLGISEDFEQILRQRLDGVRLNLTTDAMNIAADVAIARNAELGVDEDITGEPLENGRRILAEVRAREVKL